MPLRATDNPLVLPLLGLLVEQPRHQYGLLAALRERYPYLRVRTGSVYTLVASLQEVGWIAPAPPPVPGSAPRPAQPAPVTFDLTPDGAAEFRRRVAADLEDAEPANTGRFVTALAYVGILDRATAAAALTARVAALRRQADDLDRAVETSGVPAIQMIEATFYASQTRHDIAWLESFVARIGDPDQAWPTLTPDDRR